jgi:hypothetical protein
LNGDCAAATPSGVDAVHGVFCQIRNPQNLADLAGVLAFGGAWDVAEMGANQYRWL